MQRFIALFGILMMLVLPTVGSSQFPPAGFGGRGGSMGDPSRLFDLMSGGKDVISRDSITSPWMQMMFDRFAQQMGITDGQLTRDQFNNYMQQKMAAAAGGASPGSASPSGPPASGGPSKFGGFGRGGDGKGSSDGKGGGPPAPDSAETIDRWAEGSFRKLDSNGDGELNFDEMSENLRQERDKWDENKNGFIDLDEYKGYFRAAMQQRINEASGSSSGSSPRTIVIPDNADDPPHEEEPKPVVYRAGKLPKDLPSWFKSTDTDGDGQVSLLEWRKAGKAVAEFPTYDRNGDGFLTIAEVMFHTSGKNNLNGVAVAAIDLTSTGAIAKDSGKTGESKGPSGGNGRMSLFSGMLGGFGKGSSGDPTGASGGKGGFPFGGRGR